MKAKIPSAVILSDARSNFLKNVPICLTLEHERCHFYSAIEVMKRNITNINLASKTVIIIIGKRARTDLQNKQI